MKRFSIPIIALGGGLASFGLAGFIPNGGWYDSSRVEIAIGVVLLIVGILFRKEPR